MSDYLRAFLNDNRVKLSDAIHLTTTVYEVLLQANILNQDKWEDICRITHTTRTQKGNFLDYMARRGKGEWETYLDVLRDSGEPSHGPLRQLWDGYQLTQGANGRRYLELNADKPTKFRAETPARFHHHIQPPRPNTLQLPKANNAAPYSGWKNAMCRDGQKKRKLDQLVREEEAQVKRAKQMSKADDMKHRIHLIRTRPCRANQEKTIWNDFRALTRVLDAGHAMNWLISAGIINPDDRERISYLIRLDQAPALLTLIEQKVRAGLDEKEVLDVIIDIVKDQCAFAMHAV